MVLVRYPGLYAAVERPIYRSDGNELSGEGQRYLATAWVDPRHDRSPPLIPGGHRGSGARSSVIRSPRIEPIDRYNPRPPERGAPWLRPATSADPRRTPLTKIAPYKVSEENRARQSDTWEVAATAGSDP